MFDSTSREARTAYGRTLGWPPRDRHLRRRARIREGTKRSVSRQKEECALQTAATPIYRRSAQLGAGSTLTSSGKADTDRQAFWIAKGTWINVAGKVVWQALTRLFYSLVGTRLHFVRVRRFESRVPVALPDSRPPKVSIPDHNRS